jgi:hypothetical protein
MRKLVLCTIVATAGCTAVSQPGSLPPSESAARTTQADTDDPTSPGDDDDDEGKVITLRWITPHRSGGGSADGGATDGGSSAPSTGWQPLVNWASFYAGTALLLNDGTVMVQDIGSTNWWKLTPDANGSYVDGTWTQLASTPGGYQPLYFGSAVLPDGRVIVEGGEYQALEPAWQANGAIYDPKMNQWTTVAPPAGWTTIGDAQSAVLADGRYLQANCCTTQAAILDPKTLTWTAFGTDKLDINDEEGWTLLPNGDLLTVDVANFADLKSTELLNPATGVWSFAGDTPVELEDTNADGTGSYELGPQLLRPDGTVFAVGATGHSAVYDTHSAKWRPGPDFPNIPGVGQLDTADGPAVLLPNGHALVTASPGVYDTPLYMYEFDGRQLTEVPVPPDGPYDSSYNTTFLILPTGQILFTDFTNDVEIYTSTSQPNPAWAPQIDATCGLGELQPGSTYRISGTQLNGLSQGSAYGDDVQQATNYPLVRIRNRGTGHLAYARTHDPSYMCVTPGVWSSASFDVPASIEAGESDIEVVANGIASTPIRTQVEGRQR